MDNPGFLGSLLPLWIIGAPLLAGVLMMFVTPKPRHRDRRDDPLREPGERPPAYGQPTRPVVVAAPPRY